MDQNERFRIVVPPLVETVCQHLPDTCYKMVSPASGNGSCRCPFEEDCRRIAESPALKRIVQVYGGAVRVTLGEPSTSIVVRSEHQYSQDNGHRFCLRKHLYEIVPGADDGDGDGASGLPCSAVKPHELFGEYLGFIDLRPKGAKSPVAMAVLAKPRHYRHDPETYLITGNYGPLFGGASFPASVYTMNEPDLTGAACAQACIIMALSMLSDRRARILGSYTLTFLGRPRHRLHELAPADSNAKGCLHKDHRSWFEDYFEIGGLAPEDIVRVLDKGICRVSPFHVELDQRYSERLASRLIEGYVLARFPVIMAVESGEWFKKKSGRDGDPAPRENHAVLIVGVRFAAGGNSIQALIVHDPARQPFVERPVAACLAAARNMWRRTTSRGSIDCVAANMVVLTPVMDERMELDAWNFLQSLYGQSFRAFADETDPKKDFRVRLLHRDDISSLLRAGARMDERTRLVEELRKHGVSSGRHWCVAGYASGLLRYIWVSYDAESRNAPVIPQVLVDFDPSGGWKILNVPNPKAAPSGKGTATISAAGSSNAGDIRVPLARLKCSVISSSSSRSLPEIVRALIKTKQVNLLDLLVLRDQDIESMQQEGVLPAIDSHASLASMAVQLLAASDPERVAEWYVSQLRAGAEEESEMKIAALATYLPEISSRCDVLRETAIRALAKAMQIALALRTRGVMQHPIVEIVCGTLCDRCVCDTCHTGRHGNGRTGDDASARPRWADKIFVATVERKSELLVDSLDRAIREVGRLNKCYLAVELEPGSTYVVQDERSLNLVMGQIEANPLVSSRVGLNLDIAHMRIAGVSCQFLEKYKERLLHAHIADHPSMHTRDQAIGTWTSVESVPSQEFRGYHQYIRLLSGRCADQSSKMPFTGAVALELEGCDRMFWIYESLVAMNYLFDAGTGSSTLSKPVEQVE